MKDKKRDKDSGKEQYDRADGRGSYRRDPAEREEGRHAEGRYGGGEDAKSRSAIDKTKKTRGQTGRPENPEDARPKNTGRGAAGRHKGDEQKKRSD